MSNAKSVLVKGPSNIYPLNVFSWPFTAHKQCVLKTFLKYCTFTQAQLVKGLIYLTIIGWFAHAYFSGKFARHYKRNQMIYNMVTMLLKQKFKASFGGKK